jgi:hypothetical protein
MGQLAMLLRAETLVDVKAYNRVTGQPFASSELAAAIERFAAEAEEGAA